MEHKQSQFDEFDRLMLDLAEARQAGVFDATPIEVESLMAPPVLSGPAHWYRHVLVGLPLAACIAMFFGVATLWKASSETGNRVITGTAAISSFGSSMTTPIEQCQTMDDLRTCFRGPGILVDGGCRCADFDGDGDVDLRDMGAFQLDQTAD
ncbi:MAG: hypothetical protein KAV82_16670 [Phycisphaerae bacterium]|nr:hypothetical protein [Phycisphaerae bacterium]